MQARQGICRSMTCLAKCNSLRLFGVGIGLTGIALSLTLWLIPIGVPLALFGLSLVQPGEPCR